MEIRTLEDFMALEHGDCRQTDNISNLYMEIVDKETVKIQQHRNSHDRDIWTVRTKREIYDHLTRKKGKGSLRLVWIDTSKIDMEGLKRMRQAAEALALAREKRLHPERFATEEQREKKRVRNEEYLAYLKRHKREM